MSELGVKLVNSVREIAAENTDFRYVPPGGEYGSCQYVADGQPSCLIGHALWNLGVIDSTLENNPSRVGFPSAMLNRAAFNDFAADLDLDVDLTEVDWLVNVQEEQDSARPWGRAVELADLAAAQDEEEIEDDE